MTQAASLGHSKVVRVLLAANAVLEHREKEGGDTALTLAAGGGHAAAVEMLLEAGANVHHQENNGHTALSIASHNGNFLFKVVVLFVSSTGNR